MTQDQKELTEFIKTKVLGEGFDFDDLERLKRYLSQSGHNRNELFCDYYELGNWFITAMESCNLFIDDILYEVKMQLEEDYEEAAEEQAKHQADYLRIVGG